MLRIIKEFIEYRKQTKANEKAANKQGHFYLNSKTDTILLEKVIREINNNPDLTALFRTADGTTLSLRVSPRTQKEQTSLMSKFNGNGEE